MTKYVLCECAHEVPWQEWGGPGQEDAPTIGRFAWCPLCQQEQAIIEINPSYYWHDQDMTLITEETLHNVKWHVPSSFETPDTLCQALITIGAPFYRYGETVFASLSDVRRAECLFLNLDKDSLL